MKLILFLAFVLMMSGCDKSNRSITGEMWSNPENVSSVMINDSDLTEDGKNKLNRDIGKGVVYDADRKAYIIKVNEDDNWGNISLKVLATPFTIVADGVKYTVVVAVSNPQITLAILEAVLKH
jgi:uncharacterized protein YceK